jgi:group I intron endonuclease
MTGIYCIRRINRRYIGSAVDIKHRWRTHRWQLNAGIHANTHLQRAWNKYGEAAFTFEVLEVCVKSFLRECEQQWLDTYSPASLYNTCLESKTRAGYKMTDAQRTAVSARMRGNTNALGRKNPPETLQRMSEAAKKRGYNRPGYRHSAETKAKISAGISRAWQENKYGK